MAASQLPLHCSICPKKPTFSDVSHLLTHISSKSHLSHYYKIKVRSGTDIACRDLVEVYDRWYVDWGVETLMSDRMHHKEKKRPRARPPGRPPKAARNDRTPKLRLDPQLADDVTLQKDNELEETLQPLFAAMPSLQPLAMPKPTRPKLYLWSTLHPESCTATPLEISSPLSQEPTAIPWPSHSSIVSSRSSFHTPTVTSFDDNDGVHETSKLKGVFWPGMDIFDAASPETRRKRNQKKDVSVLEQLQLNSLEVEPTEMIFTPCGNLKKSRLITGHVDFDSSPLLGQVSPPVRRRAPKRPVLMDRDTNNARIPPALFPRSPTFGTALGTQTLNAQPIAGRAKPKRTFNVFHDDDEEDTKPFGEQTGMRLLTTGVQLAPTNHTAASYPMGAYTFPASFMYGPDLFGDPTDAYQNFLSPSHFYIPSNPNHSFLFDDEIPRYESHDPTVIDHASTAVQTPGDHDSQESYIPTHCDGSE